MGCVFKDILGKPGQGIHSYRLFNIAIVDTALTVLLTWSIHESCGFDFWPTLGGLVVVGELCHYFLGVNTQVMQWLNVKMLC